MRGKIFFICHHGGLDWSGGENQVRGFFFSAMIFFPNLHPPVWWIFFANTSSII
jgi:hypothetical protein